MRVARWLLLTAVTLLVVTVLTGCFGGGFFRTGGFEGKAIVPYGVRSPGENQKAKIAIVPPEDDPPEGYMPLVDATVKCENKTTKTDIDGYFRIDGLPEGTHTYEITTDDLAYEPKSDTVDIHAGQITWVGQVSTVHNAKEWLVMVYMAADNNLSDFAFDDMKEMEWVGSTSNMDIVVQVDFLSDPDARYYMEERPSQYPSYQLFSKPVEYLGEVDSGDSITLVNFVRWATERYPARKKALVIWDHGDGWAVWQKSKAIAIDEGGILDDGSYTIMNINALASALSSVAPIDVLVMDACLMNTIEVSYEIAFTGKVGYFVGSQENVPAYGLDYENWLGAVKQTPYISPEQLAAAAVDTYYDTYRSYDDITLTALSLASLPMLVNAINDLAETILDNTSYTSTVKGNVWPSLHKYPKPGDYPAYMDEAYIDLMDFVNEVEYWLPELGFETDAVRQALDDTVTHHLSTDLGYTGTSIAGVLKPYYTDLRFGAATYWSDLLTAMGY